MLFGVRRIRAKRDLYPGGEAIRLPSNVKRSRLKHSHRLLQKFHPPFESPQPFFHQFDHQLFEPGLQGAEGVSSVGKEFFAAIPTTEPLIHPALVKALVAIVAAFSGSRKLRMELFNGRAPLALHLGG